MAWRRRRMDRAFVLMWKLLRQLNQKHEKRLITEQIFVQRRIKWFWDVCSDNRHRKLIKSKCAVSYLLASRTFLHAYLPFARLYLQNYCYLFPLNSLFTLLNNLEIYVRESKRKSLGCMRQLGFFLNKLLSALRRMFTKLTGHFRQDRVGKLNNNSWRRKV